MNLDFDIKKLDNIVFDINDLLDYFNIVNDRYQHLKWTPDLDSSIDPLTHKISEIYSWAIQSNLTDPSKPCPPYHIKKDASTFVNDDFSVPTELIFGFSKILIEAFPSVRQTVISAHPPGSIIDQHIDNVEFLKIHIPIKTNSESYFVFGDSQYNLEVGNAYLINTTRMHGTINSGTTDRIHLIFKIPVNVVDHILKNRWILDPKKIEFDILEMKNLSFDFKELSEYFETVKRDFDYLKWVMPDIPNTKLKGIYGYGILTNKENPEEPCDPPGTRKDKPKYDPLNKPTKLLFGFAKKLYDLFPYMEELVITAHPPGSSLPLHTDRDEHVRIHFPILTNGNAHFIVNDKVFVLESSSVYIVNTKMQHSTVNNGNADRIHLHFKIPLGKIQSILSESINL